MPIEASPPASLWRSPSRAAQVSVHRRCRCLSSETTSSCPRITARLTRSDEIRNESSTNPLKTDRCVASGLWAARTRPMSRASESPIQLLRSGHGTRCRPQAARWSARHRFAVRAADQARLQAMIPRSCCRGTSDGLSPDRMTLAADRRFRGIAGADAGAHYHATSAPAESNLSDPS